jgi:hypothetical protein
VNDDDDDDEYMMTNIHDLSEIQTHGLSVQAVKSCSSDREGTGTGWDNFDMDLKEVVCEGVKLSGFR